ncbi:MAG: glycosyltransferase, partial [Lachnospiraceae bacterium]|nr:glycosyltransferase [Lachnospiraceae bacterium]
IDSIVNQTYQNLDIILVDDGSTDSSGSICDAYAREDNRIHVIHKENGGNGDARNAGLNEAKGSWIVMSDNDDIMHRRQIEVLLAVAEDKDADIAVGWYKAFEVNEIPHDEDIGVDYLESAEVLSDRHLFDDDFIKKRSMILAVPWSKICKKKLYGGGVLNIQKKADMTMHGQHGNCMKKQRRQHLYQLYCTIGVMILIRLADANLI